MTRTYSHTRLSTFEQCRLKYKYQYIDRIKREEDSIEAFLGSRFHDVMERLYAERAFWKPTAQGLKDYFNELWEKNWGDYVFVVRTNRSVDDYRQIGLKAVEDYFKRYVPFEQGRVLGTEKKLYARLDGGGEYRVEAWIDRLMEQEDGCYEIHDYKTSGTLPLQEYLDSDRQLALYEIAVRQAWPDVKRVDLVWHYVVFDKEMRSGRTPEELEALKKNTIALIDEIEACGEHPPHETNLCRWCDFQDICPLFAHELKTEALPAKEFLADDGVALVNQLSTLDAKKRALKVDIDVIEKEEEELKEAAIDLAGRQGVARFVGSDRELMIKDEIEVAYPDSKSPDREVFEVALKKTGIWEQVSGFVANTFKALARKQWARDGIPDPIAPYVKLESVKTAKLKRRKDDE